MVKGLLLAGKAITNNREYEKRKIQTGEVKYLIKTVHRPLWTTKSKEKSIKLN